MYLSVFRVGSYLFMILDVVGIIVAVSTSNTCVSDEVQISLSPIQFLLIGGILSLLLSNTYTITEICMIYHHKSPNIMFTTAIKFIYWLFNFVWSIVGFVIYSKMIEDCSLTHMTLAWSIIKITNVVFIAYDIMYHKKSKQNTVVSERKDETQPLTDTEYERKDDLGLYGSHGHSSSTKKHQIETILKRNGLYNKLYAILTSNELNLDTLKNDIDLKDLDKKAFNEFGIESNDIATKLAFKKLLMIVQNKINIILIGDENIGKKSVIKRYVFNKFSDEKYEQKKQQWNKQQTLSGRETMDLNIQIISDLNELNNNNVLIDVIMVCYDISNEETFINCCKSSNNILKYKNEINNKLITILVGLKSDIQNIDRKIEDKNAD
eukprot:130476_1